MTNETMPHRVAALLPLLAALATACGAGEAAAPREAVEVQVAAEAAGNPTVALDAGRGVAYVAWAEKVGEEANVMLARRGADGAALGEPVRVNAVAGDASQHEAAPPQVALGPHGEVYVVWEASFPVEGRRFPASNLRFARSTDGGLSFGPTVNINSDADGAPSGHSFHNVAVARDGAIYVAWIDSREKDRVRRERAVSATAGPAPATHGGHGQHGASEPGSELWVAVSRDGGASFQETAVLDRDVCPCCRTGLATGPDGSVYVVWRKIFDGEVRDIAIARSTDGARSFSTPVPVHRDGWVFSGCPHAGPTIAVDEAGTVHVAWYTGRDGAQGTYYAASSDGGRSFGEPLALLTGEWVPPSIARVAVDGADVWLAWDDRREDREQRTVYIAPVERGRLGSPTALRGTTPDLALAGGQRVLAWHQGQTVQLRMTGE
jgi:hypothetical protein